MINRESIENNLRHLKHLVFEVTDACNLNCKYCAYSDLYSGYDPREGKMMSFDKARLMIDYFLNLRKYPQDMYLPLTIGFYGGEPLLNMKLIRQIIEYLEKVPDTKKYIKYNMTTNAMLLDKCMDFLVEKSFSLTISLDGDETGQSYRVDFNGNNSFNRIIKNVELLKKKYPFFFDKFVNFRAVLHKRNSVESIFHFIQDKFGKIPSFSPLSVSGIKKEKISKFRSMFQNMEESYLNSSDCEALDAGMFLRSPRIDGLTKYIFERSGNVFDTFNHLIFEPVRDTLSTGTCIPFSKKLFVTVSGKILPCERIDHDFVLGHVSDNSVELLDLDVIVEKHNYYVNKIAEQCKYCGCNSQCPQCVYNIDDIREEKASCLMFCTHEQQQKRIEGLHDYLREHPFYYKKILKEVYVKS